jgi:hypothetical protein
MPIIIPTITNFVNGVVTVTSTDATPYSSILNSMGSFVYGVREMYLKANSNTQILQSYQFNKYDVNVLPTSPTFLNLMLMSENFGILPLDSLKLITYGTERMSASLLEKLSIKLPKIMDTSKPLRVKGKGFKVDQIGDLMINQIVRFVRP